LTKYANTCSSILLINLPEGSQSILRRHVNVEEHDIGFDGQDGFHHFGAVGGFANHAIA
jgi:hypothetical protein